MTERTLSLPEAPNLDWLRKQAKRRLNELRRENADAKLADAQFDLAKRYGFTSWRSRSARRALARSRRAPRKARGGV